MAHQHTCDACGQTWSHLDSRALSVEDHLCPGCKEPQFWIAEEPSPADPEMRGRFNRLLVNVLRYGPEAGEAFLSGVLLGAEMADTIITKMAEENERC